MKIEFYRKKTGKAVKGRYVVDKDGDVSELNGNSFGGADVIEVDDIGWRTTQNEALPEMNQQPIFWFSKNKRDIVSHSHRQAYGNVKNVASEYSIPLYVAPVDFEALRKENERLSSVDYCFKEWLDKTEWVQKTVQPHELGMHRADVLKNRIEALRKENEQLHQMLIEFNKIMTDSCDMPINPNEIIRLNEFVLKVRQIIGVK